MRKIQKLIFLLFLMMVSNSVLFAQSGSDIPLRKEIPQTDSTRERSVLIVPEAYIVNNTITIDYQMSTVSQVIILNADTQAVVYSAPYDATRQVVVNLSSLPEDLYELHLYAFGKWWWGEFEIDED